MKYEKTDKLLKQINACLVRKNKHEVWRLPNGKMFIKACTPSDINADNNSFRRLNNLLYGRKEFEEGERREKKLKSEKVEEKIPFNQIIINSKFAAETLNQQIIDAYKIELENLKLLLQEKDHKLAEYENKILKIEHSKIYKLLKIIEKILIIPLYRTL